MDIQHSLEKINYQTQVYDLLEDMIVHGKLKPGERLVESELAVSLGVSRAPVRVAMAALCQDGLVVNRKGNGWVVSEVSLQDIVESYELRKLVEVHTGKQGCMICSEEILNEMKTTVDILDKTFEIVRFREKDRRFHELIVLSYGNKKFHEVFLWTFKNLRYFGYLTLEIPGRREGTASEHREILEGFLKRDPEYLEKAIERHISTAQALVASNWDKYGC